MPCLRKALFEAKLRDFRYGLLVRCHLSNTVYQELLSIKSHTGRPFQDIIRVILDVYGRYKFPFRLSSGPVVIFFRYDQNAATVFMTMAWKRKVRRSRLIGGIIAAFMRRVPEGKIRMVMKNRLDQSVRFYKEVIRG